MTDLKAQYEAAHTRMVTMKTTLEMDFLTMEEWSKMAHAYALQVAKTNLLYKAYTHELSKAAYASTKDAIEVLAKAATL